VKRALELRDVAVTALPWNDPERRFDGLDAGLFFDMAPAAAEAFAEAIIRRL